MRKKVLTRMKESCKMIFVAVRNKLKIERRGVVQLGQRAWFGTWLFYTSGAAGEEGRCRVWGGGGR